MRLPLRDRLAAIVRELGAQGVGEEGSSDVGAVVAATEPALLAELRARMPRAIFLLPGVGAQGGRVEDARPGVRAGPRGARPRDRLAVDRRAPALEAGDAAAAAARRGGSCARPRWAISG